MRTSAKASCCLGLAIALAPLCEPALAACGTVESVPTFDAALPVDPPAPLLPAAPYSAVDLELFRIAAEDYRVRVAEAYNTRLREFDDALRTIDASIRAAVLDGTCTLFEYSRYDAMLDEETGKISNAYVAPYNLAIAVYNELINSYLTAVEQLRIAQQGR